MLPMTSTWDYPVVQGNQQSMHFAFLFNWAKKPWLTQKWSRSIIDKYYGYGVPMLIWVTKIRARMSAWFVMAALGLIFRLMAVAVSNLFMKLPVHCMKKWLLIWANAIIVVKHLQLRLKMYPEKINMFRVLL